ncbi:MAG: outer membrane beta-barrel protein [Bacteroidia bacterium]
MIRIAALFLLIFFCLPDLSSQTLTGKITDSGGKPVPVGNVIILSEADSSIIKGDVFLDGQFRISVAAGPVFILKITAASYTDHLQLVSKPASDTLTDLGTITMEAAKNLKEVEVVSQIPMFERDGEKVKVNVENSALSSAGTVLDVLKRSPTVMVSSSDNVSVFGKGDAIIYLDGQLVSSPEILKGISSTEIKEIEIISNPSAKYDAAGKAVINIITKKNNLRGYSGNLIQNVLYGKYLFSYSGLRLNYRTKKWYTYLSYGYPRGYNWESNDYYRSIRNRDSSLTEMKNKIQNADNQVNSHDYRAGATYYIDSLNSVSIQYNGFYRQNKNAYDNINDVSLDSVPTASIQTFTIAKPRLINNTVSLSYSRKLDTLESDLNITGQYGVFNSKDFEEITQRIYSGGSSYRQLKRNTGDNTIQIATGQADLNKSFNKKWKLESGVKDSYITNQSAINFENYSSAGEWVSDPSYFNGFNYSEDILAGYSQLRYSKSKLNMRAGIRAEYTRSNGTSKITGAKVVDREYINYFPSAFFGYDFTKDLNTSITYSSRISRPTFQDMNPFINYIDSLSSFRGNPNLLPSYTNSLEAALIYMKEASLTFSYERTNGAMNLVVDKLNDGSNAFVATTRNLDYSETYSAGITIPYELSWWTTYNYFGYMENTFAYKSDGTVIRNKKPMFYMYLYDEFRVKKAFSMEVTFEYTGAGVDGIFTFDPFYELSANIKKSFFKDKLTVRLIANDILGTNYQKGESQVKGYQVNYVSKSTTQYLLLSLNYRFGKLKSNDYRDKTVNQDEYDRIKMK